MEKITDKIAALPPNTSYFSLEFFPPKTQAGFDNLLPRLKRLQILRPLFVCVTWGAGGSTATKSIELARICQTQLGLTTCLHLTCTNMRQGVLDAALEDAKRLGIRNILALRGDEPREGEYVSLQDEHAQDGGAKFEHAVDLICYIREHHGDYFCIGAAAYPEGHPEPAPAYPGAIRQDPLADKPHLVAKMKAGADFIMTQLFYNVDAFLDFERMLREDESGAFPESVPIIPGLMPLQGWQSFKRTCKLAKVGVPEIMDNTLKKVKGDDDGVKRVGIEILSGIVDRIKTEGMQRGGKQGIHFYTLNLEKVVAQLLERSNLLLPEPAPSFADDEDERGEYPAVFEEEPESQAQAQVHANGKPQNKAVTTSSVPVRPKKLHRRMSSMHNSNPHNRVVVSTRSMSAGSADFEAPQDEAGVPREKPESRAYALAIAEGEGSLGREATWDDYPNGRWGDARSPAFGFANNYTLHPQLAPSSALHHWGHPTSADDITTIFQRHIDGELAIIPWSEEGLSPETKLIRDKLLAVNAKGWWTIASQPAVNARKSSDEIVGWGPKEGFVWQKPFVEFFLPSSDWKRLKHELEPLSEEITYFAGNLDGERESSDEASVNPVTWGAFKNKEIISPTIIESVSFRAWQDEAFGIWREWQSVFPRGSASAKLLAQLAQDVWLVNVICHDYVDSDALWDIILRV